MLREEAFPQEVPGLKSSIDDFRHSLLGICKKLFLSFGHFLKLEDPEFFLKRHLALDDLTRKSHNVIRINNYIALDRDTEIESDELRLIKL